MELSRIETKQVYTSKKSHRTGGEYPLVILNEGTPEWNGPVGELASQLPAEDILDHLLNDSSTRQGSRGNTQLNFGIAGGQSHARRTKASIAEHAGAAFPSWLKDSGHDLVVKAMWIGTKMAELLEFPWMLPHSTALYERRLAMGIQKCLGRTDIKLEHCTFFYNKIDGTKCVRAHRDRENCMKLPNVLTYAKIIRRDDG